MGAHGFTTIYFSFLVLFPQAMAFPPSCPITPPPGCPPRCECCQHCHLVARLTRPSLWPGSLELQTRWGGVGEGGEEGRDPLWGKSVSVGWTFSRASAQYLAELTPPCSSSSPVLACLKFLECRLLFSSFPLLLLAQTLRVRVPCAFESRYFYL